MFRLRFFGAIRFTLLGFFRWLFLRRTFAAFYYLPQDVDIHVDDIPGLKEELNLNIFRRENGMILFKIILFRSIFLFLGMQYRLWCRECTCGSSRKN